MGAGTINPARNLIKAVEGERRTRDKPRLLSLLNHNRLQIHGARRKWKRS
jgi:hypothetical protein